MKKALLYFSVELIDNSNSGIAKKCLGIVDAFKKEYDADVFTDTFGRVVFNNKVIKDFNTSKLSSRLYNYNDIFFGQFHVISNRLKENRYDVVYFRFQYFLSIGMLRFFKKMRKYNPEVKIYMEIPTYPFQKEKGKGFFERFRYMLNKFSTPFLARRISKIVTFADQPKIWNTPTITISNGYYDPKLQGLISKTPDNLNMVPTDEFHVAMVARFAIGHAPDILVNSLAAYSKIESSKKVFIHFIGFDKNLAECKDLTKKFGLEHQIIFYGDQPTEKIVQILSKVHVCVGTLGLTRKNVLIDSSLKSREYAFMGMPMILRTTDLDFDPSLFFVKYFPEPESLLDFEVIMNFYFKMKESHPDFKNEIKAFAMENLTWTRKLLPVFNDAKAIA